MKYLSRYFDRFVDYWKGARIKALWDSAIEVVWLTIYSIGPLIINIIIDAVRHRGFYLWKEKIVPAEILSYCLSFIAPSLYLFVKSQGTSYKLPFFHFFSLTTILIYASSLVLYLIVKNGWEPEIGSKPDTESVFFILVMVFLLTTVMFRIYSVYHGKGISNWSKNRTEQQDNFNDVFRDSING